MFARLCPLCCSHWRVMYRMEEHCQVLVAGAAAMIYRSSDNTEAQRLYFRILESVATWPCFTPELIAEVCTHLL